MRARIGIDARVVEATPSGLGTYARQLVASLAAIDSSHDYIVIRRPDSGSPLVAAPHVREVFVRWDPSTPSLGRAISRLNLDLLHSLHHFLPFGVRARRVVITLHDLIWLEHHHLIRSGWAAPIRRAATHLYARVAMPYAVHRADRIIAVSEHTRVRAIAYFGIDPRKIHTVHHGVVPAAFSLEHLQSAGKDREQPYGYFLCLGNTRPYKNIPIALEAFALCARDVPDLRLVVAGRGDSIRELQALVRRLGIANRVEFVGTIAQKDLLQWLHGAEGLLFPSLVEGFGFPVLEAMSAGCPVIISNIPTLTEIAGAAALGCEPRSAAEFAAAMTRLVGDPDLRNDLVQRGIARAAEFTWERAAEQTLAVYRELLDEVVESSGAAPR